MIIDNLVITELDFDTFYTNLGRPDLLKPYMTKEDKVKIRN